MCVRVQPRLGRQDCSGEAADNQVQNIGRLRKDMPQTGAELSRLPEYLGSPQPLVGCSHGSCLRKQACWENVSADKEYAEADAKKFRRDFAFDAAVIVQQAGLHQHTASCYKYEDSKEKGEKPQHCRFGYVHFVVLWCWAMVCRRGKEVKTAVQRVFARFGKDPVLPRGFKMSDSDWKHGLAPSVDMFKQCQPGLGSQVNPISSTDRPGRVNTVRFHPREASTLVGGIVSHRGNLDYQDLRAVIDDVDSENIQLPFEIKVRQPKRSLQCVALLTHVAPSLVGYFASSRLAAFLDTKDKCVMDFCARSFYWVLAARAGKAELPRVGDRNKSSKWKRFARSMVDAIMESMRSATQIGFYVCDYSTKPNVTTGRVLQHMHRGTQRLEAELEEKEQMKRLLELEACGSLHEPERLPQVAPLAASMSEVEKREEKVRRILIRLWSSANYAYLKGSCLQLLQLLTRRECFRTHKYWQVLTKRLIWAGHEALRRSETRVQEEGDWVDDVALTGLEVERIEGQYSVQVSNDAFLDDWYHRGEELLWMCHYIYAMYVKIIPWTDAERCCTVIPFVPHYKKAQTFAQVLEVSPRVPYMVGFTMPTRTGDQATNALYHLCLMKPSKLCKGNCGDVEHLSGHVLSHVVSKDKMPLMGFTVPARQGRRKRGADRLKEAWKAFEALQLTRAERGWTKLRKERRVAVLDDVAIYRQWFLPAAVRYTMVQSWLLPWLQGGFRHIYTWFWKQKQATPMMGNPRYTHASFLAKHPSGLALLPGLPFSVSVRILRLTGHVRADDGSNLIIADSVEAYEWACRHVPESNGGVVTGTGVHMQQLFPEEFAGTITSEVSWNMDLLAEARKRPRPNNLPVVADEDNDALGSMCSAAVCTEERVESEEDCDDDVVIEEPYSSEKGLQYKPWLSVAEGDVLEMAHRLQGTRDARGRELVHYGEKFLKNILLELDELPWFQTHPNRSLREDKKTTWSNFSRTLVPFTEKSWGKVFPALGVNAKETCSKDLGLQMKSRIAIGCYWRKRR